MALKWNILFFKGDVKVNVDALNRHDKETTSQNSISLNSIKGAKKLAKHTDVTGTICKGNLV